MKLVLLAGLHLFSSLGFMHHKGELIFISVRRHNLRYMASVLCGRTNQL